MQKIKEYEAEIAELKMRLGRKKGPDSDKDAVKLVSDIVRLGKRHCVFYAIFVPGETYHMPVPAFLHDSAIRYSTEKNIEQGPASELYSSIPEDMHEMMALTDTFGTTVSLNSLRSCQIELNCSGFLVCSGHFGRALICN